MGIRLVPESMMQHARQILRLRSQHHNNLRGQSGNSTIDVPKGHFAVYVEEDRNEEKMKRFVVPIWYLKQPLFQALLNRAEEEFGFDHSLGNHHHLVIPCAVDDFVNLTSHFRT